MGGPGSGGYKLAPGDTETHSAWDVLEHEDGNMQKLPQVRCKYCAREMAQHTSRQRAHLLECHGYLDAMKAQGIETSITRQAADPAAFFRAKKITVSKRATDPKPPGLKLPRTQEHSTAVRIQALALAESNISAERIHEITGIEPKALAGMRRLARDRGYDPLVSMRMKEEYVVDPPGINRQRGRPNKRKMDYYIDPAVLRTPATNRAPPGYIRANGLPPGNWNFVVAPIGQSSNQHRDRSSTPIDPSISHSSNEHANQSLTPIDPSISQSSNHHPKQSATPTDPSIALPFTPINQSIA